MKSILFLLLFVPLCGMDNESMLHCIKTKENSLVMGKHGEMGVYQMMPSTVRDAGGYDKAAAMRHLIWIETNLKRKGVDVSAFNIALCWNAGLERATSGKAKVESYNYAMDVAGYYFHFNRTLH